MVKKAKAVAPAGKRAIIAPSILSADLGRLAEEVSVVDRGGADWIHIDVMDGRFVPNLTWGMPVVKAVRKLTKKPLDVHLMIVEPERYIDEFAEAGADVIVIHAEATAHLHRAIQQIKEAGRNQDPPRPILAGVCLNPATPLAALDYVLPDLDLVLIMSVNPGFGGQKFIPSALAKIADLKWRIDDAGLDPIIELDGGITLDNIALAAQMGASAFVAGNAVFSAKNYAKTIAELRRRAEKAIEAEDED